MFTMQEQTLGTPYSNYFGYPDMEGASGYDMKPFAPTQSELVRKFVCFYLTFFNAKWLFLFDFMYYCKQRYFKP